MSVTDQVIEGAIEVVLPIMGDIKEGAAEQVGAMLTSSARERFQPVLQYLKKLKPRKGNATLDREALRAELERFAQQDPKNIGLLDELIQHCRAGRDLSRNNAGGNVTDAGGDVITINAGGDVIATKAGGDVIATKAGGDVNTTNAGGT